MTQEEKTEAVIAEVEGEREDGWSRIALDLMEAHARDLARKLDAVKEFIPDKLDKTSPNYDAELCAIIESE